MEHTYRKYKSLQDNDNMVHIYTESFGEVL